MTSRNLPSLTSELSLTRPDTLDITQPVTDRQTRFNDEQSRLLVYWPILVKRIWIIVAFLAFALAAAIIISLRTIPMYRAEGQITISRDPNPLGFKDNSATDTSDPNVDVDLATQVTILKSPSLALQAIQQLQSGENLKASPLNVPDVHHSAPLTDLSQLTEEQKAQLAGTVTQNLVVTVITGTRVIQIVYMSPNARRAADTVNSFISAYITQNLRTRFGAAEWLTKQLSDLQVKVEISEEKLVRYQRKRGIVGTDEKQNIITTKLEDLNRQLTDVEADRIQKQAIYQLTLSGDPEAVGAVGQDPFLQSLRAEQAELRNQLAQAGVQLGSAYPKVVELKNRMQQVNETIDVELKKTISRVHNLSLIHI